MPKTMSAASHRARRPAASVATTSRLGERAASAIAPWRPLQRPHMWHSDGPVIRRMRTSGAQLTGCTRMRADVRGPRGGVDAKMHRRDARQHREHAVDRTQVPAPDALAAAVDEPDADRRDASSRPAPAAWPPDTDRR